MLRRKQVMVSDWIDDYINEISSRFDLSYSETVRFLLSFVCSQIISGVYPDECEMNVKLKDIIEAVESRNEGKIEIEKYRKLISNVLFDSKKILNFSLNNIKKLKN